MKLFAYYAAHTFKNAVKKLFRTWVAIFLLACLALGVLIGLGATAIEDLAQGEEPELTEPAEPEEPPMDPALAAALPELIAGGVLLALWLFQIGTADKNGSRIFTPADVNLLFPAPLRPQSVLLFRVAGQMGMALLSTFYMAFQLPNLILNLGLRPAAAVVLLGTWLGALVLGTLLQTLCYTAASTRPRLKKALRPGAWAVLAAGAAAYFVYQRHYDLDYLTAAIGLFNGPWTRLVPLWGWLKAFCAAGAAGRWAAAALWGGLTLLGGAGQVWLLMKLRPDFYEDAMARSEETAARLEAAQAEQSVGFVKRKKDRAESLRRDGLRHGAGANAFFFRVLYNRTRFAKFGILNKTAGTYLAAALGVAALCRFGIRTEGLQPVMLTLGVLVFFRSLGNPLAEDTGKVFFQLAPAPMGRKLFWSALAGTACCLLDLVPALVCAAVLLPAHPLTLLTWLPLMLSVDFYGSAAGAFLDLSTRDKVPKTVKTLILVLFVYFGLLPDIGIIAVGMATGRTALGALGAGCVNLALGGIFLGVSPLFLEPPELPAKAAFAPLEPAEFRRARRDLSVAGFGLTAVLALATVLQLALPKLLPEQLLRQEWALWLLTFGPIYLAGVPAGLLILKRVPAQRPEPRPVPPALLLKAAPITLFLMYSCNILGSLLTAALTALTGGSGEPAILTYATADSLWGKLLFLVILAPLIEEFLFRKVLMDRLVRYGQGFALVLSALIFGLFHGNISQLLYAGAIGLVFGYLYLRTGRLWPSVALHMLVNALGTLAAPALLAGLEEGAFPWYAALYVLLLLVCFFLGLVLLCREKRHVRLAPAMARREAVRLAATAPGLLLFYGAAAAMTVLSLL